MAIVDPSGFDPAASAVGEDDEESAHLQAMHEDAVRYIQSHEWAGPIRETSLALGIGNIIALFLFEFIEPVASTDQQLWVGVGDLPPAYFVTDRAPDAASALTAYCELMDEWVGAIMEGGSLSDVFPIDAPLTIDNAAQLEGRLGFIYVLTDGGYLLRLVPATR
jgi:hypothetical protein